MPRDRHDAYDAEDPSPSPSSVVRGQLSRRDVLGGLLSAAALSVAVPGRASARESRDGAAGVAAAIRKTATPLRLGSNENPCGLCPAARQAFLGAADEANRYPGRSGQALIEAIARLHKVEPSWILVTPGSGELLRAATVAFTGPSRSLVVAAPTFEAPGRVAAAIGAAVQAVPVTAEGKLDLDAMAAKAAGAGLFFVCNPNNPTGSHVPAAAVAEFVTKMRTAAPDARVLVDEAYFEYVDDPAYATAVPLAAADKRVLVTRTFSKIFGMAGLRVGYAIAHPDTIADLRKLGSSGTLTGASLSAAAAALADTAHLGPERARNRDVRQFVRDRFESAGYRVLPSSANFVMIDIKRDAGGFQSLCRQQQVMVARPFPPLTTFVRLSIGTMPEMEEAVPAMLALLAAPPPVSARVQAPPFGFAHHFGGGEC
jgi:histidinol-phosphate aminotransferase